MASTGAIFAVIALIIVILAGGALALLYLYPNIGRATGTTTTPTSSSSSTTTSSSSITTSTNTTTTTNCTSSCSLQLVKSGSGPVLNSPMTTTMSSINFSGDGPCCSQPNDFANTINYTDNGNLWVVQGDLEPGAAWASANSSGLTISYKACADQSNLTNCGPYAEFHAGEAYDDIAIYGDLGAVPALPPGQKASPLFGMNRGFSFSPALTTVPSSATVFSIEVNLAQQNFNGCTNDTGSGCTYEDFAYNSATFGFDVGGNYDVVSIAEVCGISCASPALQMSAYTSNGGASVVQVLKTLTNSTYSPQHKLTIATDRKTFIDFYVDNQLIYSSSTIPIEQNPTSSGALEFSMRTSMNNETEVATFSNLTAYSSSTISASGLSSGMTLVVLGPNGFAATGNANSSGIATVDVSAEPMNLTVSITLNGNTIASYTSSVSAGAEFELTS
ncbi:MAG: hypothetical protein PXY39_07435 [archaeon]|nr:hypothetical protein [archaeon]